MDPIMAIIWLLLLIFVSWFIACFCFIPFLIIVVLTPCIPALKELEELATQGIKFPGYCSQKFDMRWAMALLWLFVTIDVSWRISFLCFPFYLLFQTLAPCFPFLEPANDFFLKGEMGFMMAILWLLVAIFISPIVAFFCFFPFYLVLELFAPCSSCCTGVTDFFLKGVQFPFYCSSKFMENC